MDPEAAAREARLQQQAYVRRQLRDQRRVQDLAFLLLTGAVAICGEETRPHLGMIAVNVHQWPKDYREAAAAELGIGERIQVIHVVPASPAALAGVSVGDVILAIDDRPLPSGQNAVKQAERLLAESVRPDQVSRLTLDRSGTELQVDVAPVLACRYNVALLGGDEINAYADGDNILITSGMLRFAETDAEVLTVLGHELAHNAMGHLKKVRANYLFGSIFDIVAAAYGVNTQGSFGQLAAQAYSQDFEAEADYVGLYIMALAGVDISEAPDFWRRMGAEHPGSIKSSYGRSHPGTAERYIALEKTISEISERQASGEQLRPTLKRDAKAKGQ